MPGLVRAVADGDGERAALVAYHIAMMSDGLTADDDATRTPSRGMARGAAGRSGAHQ
jgi:hypothetical protein